MAQIPDIPGIRSLSMSDMKSYGNLARTNLFQVTIESGGWLPLSSGEGQSFLDHLINEDLYYGISSFDNQIKDKIQILCAEATLPASSYATAEVKDNYMGIPQEFAHTRINTDIDFTFYIDRDYKMLMFFEAWMDFISGGNNPELDEPSLYDVDNNYYRRFKYPKQYKNSKVFIKKFEKDWNTSNATNISYQLINAFPKSIASIPVSYGEAELMKVTVTMNYDRYRVYREYAPFVPPTTTLDVYNSDGTLQQTATLTAPNSETGATGTLAQLANQGVFGSQTPP